MRLAVADLRGRGHWVTPEFEPRRYDTWILAAGMPPGQDAAGTTTESDHSAWVRARDLLDRHAAGEVRMLPPTVVSLEQLAAFDDATAFLADRPRVARMLPELVGPRTAPSSCAPCSPEPALGVRLSPCQRWPGQAVQADGPAGCDVRWRLCVLPVAVLTPGPGSVSRHPEGWGSGTPPSRTTRHDRSAHRVHAGWNMTSSKGNLRVDHPNTASSVCRRQSLRRARRVPWCSNPSASTASIRSSLPRSTTA